MCFSCGKPGHERVDCPTRGELYKDPAGNYVKTGGGITKCYCCREYFGPNDLHRGETCPMRHPNSKLSMCFCVCLIVYLDPDACYVCGEEGHRSPQCPHQLFIDPEHVSSVNSSKSLSAMFINRF